MTVLVLSGCKSTANLYPSNVNLKVCPTVELERPDEAWMTPVSTPIKPTAEQIKKGKKTDALYIATENNILWQSDRDKATALQEYVRKVFKDKSK